MKRFMLMLVVVMSCLLLSVEAREVTPLNQIDSLAIVEAKPSRYQVSMKGRPWTTMWLSQDSLREEY
jgi:hypothetical protein